MLSYRGRPLGASAAQGDAMDWNELAGPWIAAEAGMEAAHRPVADALIEAAVLRAGERVLDVGCGSGATTLRAARVVAPGGRVTGFDLAEAFIGRLMERAEGDPAVTGVVGDAATHAFAPVHDAVISLFGVMFFEEDVAAFANLGSALKPGGRLVFACWSGPEDNPWFSIAGRAAATHVPELPRPDPTAPGPMRYGNAGVIDVLLRKAGFAEIDVITRPLHLTPTGGAPDAAAMLMGVGPLRRAVPKLSPPGTAEARLAAIEDDVAEGFRAFEGPEGLRVPAVVHVVTARRPG